MRHKHFHDWQWSEYQQRYLCHCGESLLSEDVRRSPVTCTGCQKPLTDLKTFGDVSTPMCWSCHSALLFDEDAPYDWLLNLKELWFVEERENHAELD